MIEPEVDDTEAAADDTEGQIKRPRVLKKVDDGETDDTEGHVDPRVLKKRHTIESDDTED